MLREVLAKSAKNQSGARDGEPEALVVEHEPIVVDDQLGAEVVLRVAVAVLREPGVPLAHRTDLELGQTSHATWISASPPTSRPRRRIGSVFVAGVKLRSTSTQSPYSGGRSLPAHSAPSSATLRRSPPAKATSTSTSVVAHAESTVTA